MNRVTESDERALIEAAQQDPGRFAELYELNFHRVYAYIASRSSSGGKRARRAARAMGLDQVTVIGEEHLEPTAGEPAPLGAESGVNASTLSAFPTVRLQERRRGKK